MISVDDADGFFARRRASNYGDYGLFGLPPAHRRALEGELAELERAWREAEEIAQISDGLLVPLAVESALDRMRGE